MSTYQYERRCHYFPKTPGWYKAYGGMRWVPMSATEYNESQCRNLEQQHNGTVYYANETIPSNDTAYYQWVPQGGQPVDVRTYIPNWSKSEQQGNVQPAKKCHYYLNGQRVGDLGVMDRARCEQYCPYTQYGYSFHHNTDGSQSGDVCAPTGACFDLNQVSQAGTGWVQRQGVTSQANCPTKDCGSLQNQQCTIWRNIGEYMPNLDRCYVDTPTMGSAQFPTTTQGFCEALGAGIDGGASWGAPLGPVDCVPGTQYTAWGECSVPCGGGTQTRTRTGDQQPKRGGQACPSTTESRECNTQSCGPTTQCWVRAKGAPSGTSWDSVPLNAISSQNACLSGPGRDTTGYDYAWSTGMPSTAGIATDCVFTSDDMSNICVRSTCTPDDFAAGRCGSTLDEMKAPCGTTGFIPVENTVTTQAANGGQACPPRFSGRACQANACPAPTGTGYCWYKFRSGTGPWYKYGTQLYTSAQCDAFAATFEATNPNQYEWTHSMTRPTATPVDCEYTPYDGTNGCISSQCSPADFYAGTCTTQAACGTTGYIPVENVVTKQAANGGQACPPRFVAGRSCNAKACATAVDCEYTENEQNICIRSDCTPIDFYNGQCTDREAACGTQGYKPWSRSVTKYGANGGQLCGNQNQDGSVNQSSTWTFGDRSRTCDAEPCASPPAGPSGLSADGRWFYGERPTTSGCWYRHKQHPSNPWYDIARDYPQYGDESLCQQITSYNPEFDWVFI